MSKNETILGILWWVVLQQHLFGGHVINCRGGVAPPLHSHVANLMFILE